MSGLFRKLFRKKETCGISSAVGSCCIVTERIDTYAGRGEAKVHGEIWSARGVGDSDVFEVGDKLRVVAIEGVKLICKK